MKQLGIMCTDTVTGLKGMLTHFHVELNGARFYNFQPHGLNPKTGQPQEMLWIVEGRVSGGQDVDEPDLPVNVLGTQVQDKASGFSGTATALTLHINGCVHIIVQPKGRLAETGDTIKQHEFDIRRLVGDAIKALTEDEYQKDIVKRPSPAAMMPFSPTAGR